jgi:hypothetical protein
MLSTGAVWMVVEASPAFLIQILTDGTVGEMIPADAFGIADNATTAVGPSDDDRIAIAHFARPSNQIEVLSAAATPECSASTGDVRVIDAQADPDGGWILRGELDGDDVVYRGEICGAPLDWTTPTLSPDSRIAFATARGDAFVVGGSAASGNSATAFVAAIQADGSVIWSWESDDAAPATKVDWIDPYVESEIVAAGSIDSEAFVVFLNDDGTERELVTLGAFKPDGASDVRVLDNWLILAGSMQGADGDPRVRVLPLDTLPCCPTTLAFGEPVVAAARFGAKLLLVGLETQPTGSWLEPVVARFW